MSFLCPLCGSISKTPSKKDFVVYDKKYKNLADFITQKEKSEKQSKIRALKSKMRF